MSSPFVDFSERSAMDAHKTIQSIFHILGILVILGFLTLQVGGCMILVAAMSEGNNAAPTAEKGRDEQVFGDADAQASFLHFPVQGIIQAQAEENFLGLRKMSLLEMSDKLLEHARESEDIAGILLDIDSPGGAIDPSDILFHELRRFREETGKPVIAQLNGVAASGGYYVAVAADRIVAHPSCITGSIGVIIQSWNAAGLFDKLGVELTTLTSGPNKDLLNPGRPLREEERKILMGLVQDAYESFVGAVAEGRGMDPGLIRDLGDGRIYTARQALENGLIDRIGYQSELLEELRQAAGVQRVDVVQHRLPSRFWEFLEMGLEGRGRRSDPASRLDKAFERLQLEPGLYYLWHPGL